METAASLADLDAEETKEACHTRSRFSPRHAVSNKQASTKTASLMNLQTIAEL